MKDVAKKGKMTRKHDWLKDDTKHIEFPSGLLNITASDKADEILIKADDGLQIFDITNTNIENPKQVFGNSIVLAIRKKL